MKRNTGTTDKIIRIIVAVILAILYATGNVSGQWGIAILVIAGVLLLTALAGFCPLYWVLGINTCKRALS